MEQLKREIADLRAEIARKSDDVARLRKEINRLTVEAIDLGRQVHQHTHGAPSTPAIATRPDIARI
jgi:septal ring factor EnvC (AmiA/AmiB activator)